MTVGAPPGGLLERHVDELARLFPGTTATPGPGGTTVVSIPSVPLSAHWRKSHTSVWFLVPVGYPMAGPDCFWAEADLALVSGGAVKNASQQVPPFGGPLRLWFSWHVQRWDPHVATLLTYLRVIRDRLARPE